MFKPIKKTFLLVAGIAVLALSLVACKKDPEEKPYDKEFGITVRAKKQAYKIYEKNSASEVVENADGSVEWVATSAGGAGGGVSFYVNPNKNEINIGNYKSIQLQFEYAPVEGKWAEDAQNPGFCLRMLTWDSTGMFGGYEDLEYFDSEAKSGEMDHTVEIPDTFAAKVESSAGVDSILGFVLKFNDYQRGNADGDQLKVRIKNVIFNAKEGAPADKPFSDGLKSSQRGKVVEINYPSKDYVEFNAKEAALKAAAEAEAAAVTDEEKAAAAADKAAAEAMTVTEYEKHAWVYLPAGYSKKKEYPVFILLHGFGQNENTWGLTDKGRGGKIKGYMDKRMANGTAKKFILVVVTGVADKSWGPNGGGYSFNGFNAFGGELRNDLLPFIKKTYKIKEGRENVALAGLSMGGGQTFTIGIGENLDQIANFAGFSGALFTTADSFIAGVDAKFDASLKIKNLYMTCGDDDGMVYGSYPSYVEAMKNWDRVENFDEYTFPGGTHDFPVWYHGFDDFIQMIFQDTPVQPNKTEE